MSIQELSAKLKGFCTGTDTLLVGIIVGTGILSFVLGRLSVAEESVQAPMSQVQAVQEASAITSKEELVATSTPVVTPAPATAPAAEPKYVGSRNGTKYHLPWCAGAKQIKEENKVFFSSKEEAEKSGYTPASNCKGI
jgi:hypothetical protein